MPKETSEEREPTILFLAAEPRDPHDSRVPVLCLGGDEEDILTSREMVGWLEVSEDEDGDVHVVVRAREGTIIIEIDTDAPAVAALERWFVGAPPTEDDRKLYCKPGERRP